MGSGDPSSYPLALNNVGAPLTQKTFAPDVRKVHRDRPLPFCGNIMLCYRDSQYIKKYSYYGHM